MGSACYIEKFNPQGNLVSYLQIGGLTFTTGMFVHPDGNLWATINGRLNVFGPAGEVIGTFGSSGSGPGQFHSPLGIALDSHGLLYVVDELNFRVQKFAMGSTPVRQTSWGRLKALYRGTAAATR